MFSKKVLKQSQEAAKYHFSMLGHFGVCESLGLPGNVVEADVIVSSVVVETDFDAVTAAIIVEGGVLVSIGVI